jgi:RNA polymerase sigma-70 factor (ECF subfamily)
VGEGIDPELVARLRSGDGAAFDAVYDAYREQLFRFLARLTGRREVAEDLFQETWMRLAQHARTLRDDTNLRAWLFAVARNLARSHGRWTILDARTTRALARWWYLGAPPAPDDEAAANATLSRLEEAFAALPDAHREVLALAAGEGLPHDEVGRILGLSPEATRQRLARARAVLARRLEEPADISGRKTWKKSTLSSKA